MKEDERRSIAKRGIKRKARTGERATRKIVRNDNGDEEGRK